MTAPEPAVPRGPQDLTPAWLTATLHTHGYDGTQVDAVVVTPVGTGQTGASYRLEVDYGTRAEGLPSTFVAKLAAQDPEVRQRVSLGYRSEVAFYAELAATVRVPMPHCFAGGVDEDGHCLLLLSDLAPARQGDQLAGCTIEQARAAAVALAGLHGPRWCDPTWLDLDVTTMPLPTPESAAGMGEVTRMAVDLVLARLGDRLSASTRATVAAFPDAVAPWLMARQERFALLHGDYRLDNLLFGPDGTVCVVDWQTLAVGLPPRDLAYLLATGLQPADRRGAERELVEAYRHALEDHGVAGYDAQTCWDDYRLGQLHTLLIACLGAAFSTTTERGDEMTLVMLERGCTAVRDLGTLALLGHERILL
jgi:fructosamine-3-kinase